MHDLANALRRIACGLHGVPYPPGRGLSPSDIACHLQEVVDRQVEIARNALTAAGYDPTSSEGYDQ